MKVKDLLAGVFAGAFLGCICAEGQIVSVVNTDSGLTGNSTTNSTSENFTVGTGADVLVVEMVSEENNGPASGAAAITPAITFGGTALTLASGVTSYDTTQRSAFIFYLSNPTVGVQESIAASYSGATVNNGLAIYAFTLANVNTGALPIAGTFASSPTPPANGTSTTGTLSAALSGGDVNTLTEPAITGIQTGALGVTLSMVGNSLTINTPTVSVNSGSAVNGSLLYSNANTIGIGTSNSATFSNLSAGSSVFQVTDNDTSGDNSSKSLFDAVVFNAVPEPSTGPLLMLGLLLITASSALRRLTRTQAAIPTAQS